MIVIKSLLSHLCGLKEESWRKLKDRRTLYDCIACLGLLQVKTESGDSPNIYYFALFQVERYQLQQQFESYFCIQVNVQQYLYCCSNDRENSLYSLYNSSMNRQPLLLLFLTLILSVSAGPINNETPSPLSESANGASSPSLTEPQVPSNNKPQPFKGPTVETIPTLQSTASIQQTKINQSDPKQDTQASTNSSTTIGKNNDMNTATKVLPQDKAEQSIVTESPISSDVKPTEGEILVEMAKKTGNQLSNEEKLKRQAIQQKKERQNLPQSKNSQTVKTVPQKVVSYNETSKNVEITVPKPQQNSNSTPKKDDKKTDSTAKDNSTSTSTIRTSTITKEQATVKQEAPENEVKVEIIEVKTDNKTTIPEKNKEEAKLETQNKTQIHEEVEVKPIIKEKSSNEIKIIPLDNEEDETNEDQDEEEQEEQTKSKNSTPIIINQKETKTQIPPILKQNPQQAEKDSVNAKKTQAKEPQKSVKIQEKVVKSSQTKKQTQVVTKKEAVKDEIKQKPKVEEKVIVQKKEPQQQKVQEKKQKDKNEILDTKSKVKVEEKQQIIQEKEIISKKEANVQEKPAIQSINSEITKPSKKEDASNEHSPNLSRQKQPQKVIVEDINEASHQQAKKAQIDKEKTKDILQQQQPKNVKEGSLQQLLEQVKSDLTSDAKVKIIKHLQDQIKEQQKKAIIIQDEKLEPKETEYLQLQTFPRQTDTQKPQQEDEVSSQQIMDTKTVLVIIVLTFIISIPIVREIKSKAVVKESKNKMENDPKESSQTLGLEFSELDNETGYDMGQPLDQQER